MVQSGLAASFGLRTDLFDPEGVRAIVFWCSYSVNEHVVQEWPNGSAYADPANTFWVMEAIDTGIEGEEKFGIRKYAADPDGTNANRELAVFGRTGFPEDREGLGLYVTGPGAGYLLCSDQRANASWIRIFPREGSDHAELGAVATDCDGTDGIDSVWASLGPRFPNGMVAMMNSRGKNFKLFSWKEIARCAGLRGR